MKGELDETGIYTNRTLVAFFLVASAVSAVVVAIYAPLDWGWLRILAAGGLMGGLAFLATFVNHLLIPPLER